MVGVAQNQVVEFHIFTVVGLAISNETIIEVNLWRDLANTLQGSS